MGVIPATWHLPTGGCFGSLEGKLPGLVRHFLTGSIPFWRVLEIAHVVHPCAQPRLLQMASPQISSAPPWELPALQSPSCQPQPHDPVQLWSRATQQTPMR